MATPYNLTGGASGDATSGGTGTPFNIAGTAATTPTASQQLQLAYAKAHKPSGNFLSGVAHDTGSLLSKTLNILGRPVDAVMGGITAGAAAGDKWNFKTFKAIGHGAKEGIEGKNFQGVKTPDTFTDYIKTAYPNFAKQHKVITAITGLAGEIGLDPTLPLIAGGTLIHGVGDAAEAAKVAQLTNTGATLAERIKSSQEAIDALKDLGPAFDARRIYANLALEHNEAEAAGDVSYLRDTSKTQTLTHAATEASRESADAGQKVLQAKYAIPFSKGKSIALTPTMLGGRRVAPLVPTLARMSAKKGVLGKLPLVPHLAEAIGTMFKHGFKDAAFAKPALEAQHFEKHYNGLLSSHSMNTVTRPYKHMSEDDMLEALHFGETHVGVVTRDAVGRGTFHPNLVANSHLSQDQQGFLQAWHNHAEVALDLLRNHAVPLEDHIGDRVYVPHNFNTDGGVIRKSAVRGAMGLTHARASQDTNLKDIAEAINGKVKNLNVETNPHVLIAMMNMNTAVEAAKTTMLRHMRLAAGVASRIPDLARQQKAREAVEELQAKQDDLKLLVNQKAWKNKTSHKLRDMARKRLKAAIDEHGSKTEAIHASVLEHTGNALDRLSNPLTHTPSWSDIKTIGSDSLKKQITHFEPEDRRAALKLHADVAENKRLTSKLARLGDPKGGPATAHKALAEEVAAHLSNSMKIDTESARIPITSNAFKPSTRGESWKGNLSRALSDDRKELQERYSGLTKKYPNERNVNHAALARRAQGRINTEEARFVNKVAKINSDLKMARAREDTAFEKKFETQSRLHNNLQKKIDSQVAIATHATTRNPDIPKDFVQWTRKIDGKQYHFPPEVHAAMTRVEQLSASDEQMKKIADGARSLLQKWKIGVTSANPGYAARNQLSEIWNMTLDGIPMARILQYGGKTLKLVNDVHKIGDKAIAGETLTAEEAIAYNKMVEMAGHGVLNGLFQGDVQEAAKMFNSKAKARDYLKSGKPLAAYVRFTQDLNRNRENWSRITSYLYHREYEGLSASDAADRVKTSLFDYQELTPTEQGKFKMVVPFWTWTRKNIPYQLQHVLGRPGKFSNFAKIAETSNDLAGGSPFAPDASEGTLPTWMKQGYGFRVPGFGSETYYEPNFGVNDLAKLENPKTAISLVNPVAQVGFTLATGTDTFTGEKITGGTHPRNPVSGWAADVLKYLPGSDVGTTERSVRGQEVQGPGINPWYSYALSQLPESSLLTSSSNIKQAQRGSGLSTLAYLGGVPLYKRDIPSEVTGASLNEQTKEQQWARGLRDEGLAPPTKKKTTSAFQSQINAIIAGG